MKILMPQLGETVTSGTIAKWHLGAGETVKKGDTLFEVETDKADMEVPAPEDGTLASIEVSEGEEVDVGTVVATLRRDGEELEPVEEAAGEPPASDAGAEPGGHSEAVIMPQLGETVDSGTIEAWHVKVGDPVSHGDTLFEVATDKADMEVPAQVAGTVSEIRVAAGETVDVGVCVAVIATAKAPATQTEPAQVDATPDPLPPKHEPSPVRPQGHGLAQKLSPAVRYLLAKHGLSLDQIPAEPGKRVRKRDVLNHIESLPAPEEAAGEQSHRDRLSPAVRKIAAEHGIDLSRVRGTGPKGRITKKDLQACIASQGSATPAGPVASEGPREEPFSSMRRAIGEHMVRSLQTSPHVFQGVEVNYSGVDRVRRKLRDAWKREHGYSLTYLPFIAHALCRALAQYPRLNAEVKDDRLLINPAVHLGIAVDLHHEGLVVPVLRDAQRLTVPALAAGFSELARQARAGALKSADYAGGTYTISNSGSFQSLFTTPIINQPQVAILSTDGVQRKPAVVEVDGEECIAIQSLGILGQSFDHRVVDGAYSAAFLRTLKGLIEDTDWFAHMG